MPELGGHPALAPIKASPGQVTTREQPIRCATQAALQEAQHTSKVVQTQDPCFHPGTRGNNKRGMGLGTFWPATPGCQSSGSRKLRPMLILNGADNLSSMRAFDPLLLWESTKLYHQRQLKFCMQGFMLLHSEVNSGELSWEFKQISPYSYLWEQN